MSVPDVVATALVIVICLGGLAILPRVWKGWYVEEATGFHPSRSTHGGIALFWWPFGKGSQCNFIRGLIPAIGAVWALLIAGLAARIASHVNDKAARALHITAVAFLACFVIALALHFTVVLFNQPKFLVPPPQRGDPGLLAARGAKHPEG